MNRKQLTILMVAGVVICGLGLYFYKSNNQSWEDSGQKLGQKLIKEFPMNDVERITVKQPQGQLNLAKKNETWVVQERSEYPANFSNISDFLRKVWELKLAQPVKVGPSQLARLELGPPDKGTNLTGTLVEFKDKTGKTINSLVLGKKHMKESPGGDAGMGGGGWPDGRYVMVGSDVKTVGVVAEPFTSIEAKPAEWLNKDFFKVEKLRVISVTTTNATNNWKLTRESETGEWKLAEAKPGEQLDAGKSSGVTSAFSSPSFNDLATNTAPDHTGLGKPLSASLETFDGFTYEVALGNKTPDDNYYFKMAVNGSFPKERTPGKDEKPEDKTKLDKEFQEKAKQLADRLKTEKEFEKWVYVVPRYTIEPMLKERRELLAEKKEEPKEEPKASQSPLPPNSVVSPPVQVPFNPPLKPPQVVAPKASQTPPPLLPPPASVVSPPVKVPLSPPEVVAPKASQTPPPPLPPPASVVSPPVKAPSIPVPKPPEVPAPKVEEKK